MPLSRDSRQERKWKLWRRTQFRFKQGLERIDFEEDILGPEIEAMKAGKAVAGLPANAAFDIEIVHESPADPAPADTRE